MKDRLVFWGKKKEGEKVLITIDLNEDEGTYEVSVIRGDLVTEDFDNLVRNQWRNGAEEVVFPEIEETFVKELSLTHPLLPIEYEVEREDLIKMAQAEWNFLVLSKRLKSTYQHELNELEERIESIEEFSQDVWSEMKNFWNKVQSQIRENNLARRHGNEIRKKTNELFNNLKNLRAKAEDSFNQDSQANKKKFQDKLDGIKAKMESGKSLRPLFEELKNLQRDLKKVKFTREDQNTIWNQLDGLFKEIKEKKYGSAGGSSNSPLEKTTRRLEGLKSAIEKMESSIGRDKSNLNFEQNKIQNAGGQLEAQLRQAKLSLIEERIRSKELKLEDMLKTQKQLNKRIQTLQKQEENNKKEAERKEAEKAVKARIAEEIKVSQAITASDPTVIKAAELLTDNESDNSEVKSEVESGKSKSEDDSKQNGSDSTAMVIASLVKAAE
ncbi:hypothetical protein [Membranihabitans marinus]|uniref:hypothetical protein n=1 Tax=Membranihabitans marinus TaxID=1227546 RepID=UPI001F3B6255|nr:hypothetical protein [Membranihabitans marinus]